MLLASVLLENRYLLSHLLLHEHVVLHAALEYFGSFTALITDPSCIALFIEVRVRNLLNIQKYVVGRLVRVVKNTCYIIKVKTADVSPVNALLFVKLEIEERQKDNYKGPFIKGIVGKMLTQITMCRKEPIKLTTPV